MQHDDLRILSCQTGLYSANAHIIKDMVLTTKTSMNFLQRAQIHAMAAPLKATGTIGGVAGGLFNVIANAHNIFKGHKDNPHNTEPIEKHWNDGFKKGNNLFLGGLADDLYKINHDYEERAKKRL